MTSTLEVTPIHERSVAEDGKVKLDIVYFDGGGAHKSVALALQAELGRSLPEAAVRTINTDQIFSPFPLLDRLTRAGIKLYNAGLQWEKMIGLRQYIRLGQALMTSLQPFAPRLAAFWRAQPPQLVISTIPLCNGIIFAAARSSNPDVVCVTIPVDLEEFHRRYWFDPALKSYYLCGTERLRQQALASEVPKSQVFALQGMPIHPLFYAPANTDRAVALEEFGLRGDLPTVLIFFGGQGSKYLVDIARRLDASAIPLNMIVICGGHKVAYEALGKWRSRQPKLVVGYTARVADYMRLANVMVGKPGPISIYEAIACRVPLVLVDNPSLRLLFEYNLSWVEQQGIGQRVQSLADIPAAVSDLLGADHWRQNMARIQVDANADVTSCLRQLIQAGKLARAAQV
jgi:UDP-N-acetylglucosamine:LPS N-acetylglucosamine transferase